MANEIVIFDETGLTYTAKVLASDASTQVGSTVSLSETGTPPAYRGDMPAESVANTVYYIQFIQNSITEQAYFARWTGTNLVPLGDGYGVWGGYSGDRTLTSSNNVTSSSVSGSRIELVRAVTFSNQWTGLTISATWEKIYFTIKSDPDQESDSESITQILVTNPANVLTDGLTRINGGSGTLAEGSITVDQPGGSLTVSILDNATALLAPEKSLYYDFKVIDANSDSQLPLRDGLAQVVSTPTRTI